MRFSTFGPFHLEELSPEGIRSLYKQINTVSGLEQEIGVYIVATRREGGGFLPWYVGKTHDGFGKRLKRHFDNHRFDELYSRFGAFSVFLIAQATYSGKLKKVNKSMNRVTGLKSINWLEVDLIKSCLQQNDDILNRQEVKFHRSIHVPGYLNSPPTEHNESAEELARMLGVR
jgi:hypothetical protein